MEDSRLWPIATYGSPARPDRAALHEAGNGLYGPHAVRQMGLVDSSGRFSILARRGQGLSDPRSAAKRRATVSINYLPKPRGWLLRAFTPQTGSTKLWC
jgi:hypothetical protein